MTIIEVETYHGLPLGQGYCWVVAATLETAQTLATRKVGTIVYHWRNIWAFEVE